MKTIDQFCFSSQRNMYAPWTQEGVKVPMPAHQVLPLTAYIFEASYSTSATQANKI